MKKITIILILIIGANRLFSQTYSSFYYKNSSTSFGYACASPMFAKLPDGNLMGIGLHSNFQSVIFKTDANGNMYWQKLLSFDSLSLYRISSIAALNDSSAAITFINIAGTFPDFVTMKVSSSGMVLWVKGFDTVLSDNVVSTCAGGSAGVMIARGHSFIYLDGSGNVVNALNYAGFNALDVIKNQNNTYTLWGYKSSNNFCMLDIDSLGIITNYKNYLVSNENVSNGSFGHNRISESTTAGHYCSYSLNDTANNKIGVFYFNAQQQPVWAKKIEFNNQISPVTVKADADNGCIVSAFIVPQNLTILPMVLRFDSTGALSWVKTFGQNIVGQSFGITTLFLDSASSGWIISLNKPDLFITHADSAFNGYCNYSTIIPLDSNLILSTNIDTTINIPLIVTDTVLQVTSLPLNIYKYDGCNNTLIDSVILNTYFYEIDRTINIFPNPANGIFTINYELTKRENGMLQMIDVMGKEIFKQVLPMGSTKQSISLYGVNEGIYFVKTFDGEKYYCKKLIVEHN